MICARDERPLRLWSDKLIVEELADELMIYDPDRNKAFCLNQTAAFVWNHCDGTKTIAEITALMGQQAGRAVDEQIVRIALNVLAKDELLSPSSIVQPVASAVTRRGVLKKLGVGAVAAPLVTVLFVSPDKAHASSFFPVPAAELQNSKGKTSRAFGWLNR